MGGFVYGLLSPSGRCYIGQASNLRERMYRHEADAIRYKKDFIISRAIRKYGMKSFKMFVLAKDAGKEWRDFYESLFIGLFDAHSLDGGYNATCGGDGSEGFRHSLTVKRSISERQKGKRATSRTRERMREGHRRWYASGNRKPPMSSERIHKCVTAMKQANHLLKGMPNTPARAAAQIKATEAAALKVRGSKWTKERRAKVAETWRRKLGR